MIAKALEVAADRAEFVINRYREVEKNLGTPFRRIIHRAGLTPWPKVFQNLRSSRETELLCEHPLHVVVAWVGNSQPVAMNHSLQARDEDFELGADEKDGAKNGAAIRRKGWKRFATGFARNAKTPEFQ